MMKNLNSGEIYLCDSLWHALQRSKEKNHSKKEKREKSEKGV